MFFSFILACCVTSSPLCSPVCCACACWSVHIHVCVTSWPPRCPPVCCPPRWSVVVWRRPRSSDPESVMWDRSWSLLLQSPWETPACPPHHQGAPDTHPHPPILLLLLHSPALPHSSLSLSGRRSCWVGPLVLSDPEPPEDHTPHYTVYWGNARRNICTQRDTKYCKETEQNNKLPKMYLKYLNLNKNKIKKYIYSSKITNATYIRDIYYIASYTEKFK